MTGSTRDPPGAGAAPPFPYSHGGADGPPPYSTGARIAAVTGRPRHEERRPGPQQVASRRRVIVLLVVAFTAVMAGLVLIDAVVLGTLRPQLAELSRIGDDHARALAGATRLRDDLAALRRTISATVRRSAPPFDPAPALERLDDTLAELEHVSDSQTEQSALSRVQGALGRSRAAALRVERSVAALAHEQAARELEDFADGAADASRAADDIVRYNAGEVRDAAGEVRRSIYRAMVATSALAVFVLIAALVLLRHAVRAVTAHSTLLEVHASEMAAFAARAAHELRSPLQTLTLAVAALRGSAGPSSLLDRAEASTRRLSSTISDILEFSRAGGAVDANARCEVAAAVEEVKAEVASPAEAAKVALAFDVQPGLFVAMPIGHLRTVISNLIVNAIKYGRGPDGGLVTLTVRGEAAGVGIVVSDTGPGIPPDAAPHLFEPFYRASTQPDGYGLGLATVKRLVEAHGGRIELVCGGGPGATFRVKFPRASA